MNQIILKNIQEIKDNINNAENIIKLFDKLNLKSNNQNKKSFEKDGNLFNIQIKINFFLKKNLK